MVGFEIIISLTSISLEIKIWQEARRSHFLLSKLFLFFGFHHIYIYMFKSCLYLKQSLPILLKRHICVDLHYPTQRQWHPTPVLLPGKSHGWRNLVGCRPWGHKQSETTERLHFHFSLSCIGEGNGNPLQCSCLENPRDGRAWWAAMYGVTESDPTQNQKKFIIQKDHKISQVLNKCLGIFSKYLQSLLQNFQ